MLDESELIRYVEAVAIGELADARLEAECRRRGLRSEDCLDGSPLLHVAAPAGGATRRDQ